MKKSISVILFILSLVVVTLSIAGSIYGICDINRMRNDLANDTSASGIDYMGIGWGYGIILFVASAIALILSAINIKMLKKKSLQYISVAEVFASVILIVTSVFMFYA